MQLAMVGLGRMGANIVSQATQLGDRPHMEKLIGAIKVMLDGYTRDRFDRLMIFSTRSLDSPLSLDTAATLRQSYLGCLARLRKNLASSSPSCVPAG